MKRIFALFLALMMLLTMVACGGEAGTGNTDDLSVESGSGESPEKSDSGKNEIGDKAEPHFEEITVVNNDQCVIKITGIDPDNMWGYTLKAYLENKSTDKVYMFSVTSAAINGIQSDPLFSAEVAAGKKANAEISFTDSNLSANGIDVFTDIELSFRVYDSADWSADNVAEETIHIYPLGEDKASTFVRENAPDDTIIIDNDSVSVVVTDYEEDSIWGYSVNLYLVNKTDKELTYSVDEASVNGFMADPFWATSVSAGKAAFSSMSWSDSALEDNGITTVEEIEMKFRIYTSDDWSAEDIFNETVTLNP